MNGQTRLAGKIVVIMIDITYMQYSTVEAQGRPTSQQTKTKKPCFLSDNQRKELLTYLEAPITNNGTTATGGHKRTTLVKNSQHRARLT